MTKSRMNGLTNIEETVRKYIDTGTLSDNYTKESLLKTIAKLTPTEKDSLRTVIECSLPMDQLGYMSPIILNLPKAAIWAVLIGIAVTVALLYQALDPYIATGTGLVTSGITLFAQQQYKTRQTKNMWRSMEQRANEFDEHLPEEAHSVRR